MKPSIVKVCSCGLEYDAAAWEALPLVGPMPCDGVTFELRNCPCTSTIAIEIARDGIEPYADDEIEERTRRIGA